MRHSEVLSLIQTEQGLVLEESAQRGELRLQTGPHEQTHSLLANQGYWPRDWQRERLKITKVHVENQRNDGRGKKTMQQTTERTEQWENNLDKLRPAVVCIHHRGNTVFCLSSAGLPQCGWPRVSHLNACDPKHTCTIGTCRDTNGYKASPRRTHTLCPRMKSCADWTVQSIAHLWYSS